MINRRDVMLGGLAGAAALGLGRVNPDFLVNSAFAAEGKALRFLGAEALTGNWDPTTHTNLGQLIVEGFVFGYLTRAPMKPERPDELVFEHDGSESAEGHQVPRRLAVHGRGRQGHL
jgi:peptide/nickel transport system substrate-binding protein